ncbi:MAG: thioesterase family protein [Bacteroidota bacterium]|jgi:acyl-CoA thioester hydrolase
MDIQPELFRHRHPIRVRFHHVDRMHVVHSLRYFFFFEEARLEYIRNLGLPVDQGIFVTHDRFFIVRNSCDYFAPAYFDEELTILTRIAFVRNSSIVFEHVALKSDGTLVARAEHVFVHVDLETDRPARVPEHLREMILAHEGENVEFIEG